MKRILIPALAILMVLATVGCSSETQLPKEEEAKMREALEAGKEPLDINKVPPDIRDKVKGLLGSQEPGGPAVPPTPK